MPETQDHLRIRIPEKGELTLSMPDGVLRALRDQRLPSFAEVWHDKRQEWVSLAAHPGVLGLLQSISAHSAKLDQTPTVRVAAPPRISNPHQAPPFIASPRVANKPVLPPQDDTPDLVLDGLADPLPSAAELLGDPIHLVEDALPIAIDREESEMVQASAPAIPTETVEKPASGGQTEPDLKEAISDPPSQVKPVEIVVLDAGASSAAEPSVDREIRRVPVKRSVRRPALILLIAAVAAVVLVGGAGAWWYLHTKSLSDSKKASNTAASPAARVIQATVPPVIDTLAGAASTRNVEHEVAVPDLPLQGVSGAGPEPELETSLRLAHAVVWVAAEDFGSPAAILLARHKVEAARNSVIAYRIDMQRLPDSARLAMDYERLREPFDEAAKIDSVLVTMQSAIQLLDALQGRFQVNGSTLRFARSADANQWNSLRLHADSILAAPVELDAYPGTIRAPRRVVTRLVRSLPTAQ